MQHSNLRHAYHTVHHAVQLSGSCRCMLLSTACIQKHNNASESCSIKPCLYAADGCWLGLVLIVRASDAMCHLTLSGVQHCFRTVPGVSGPLLPVITSCELQVYVMTNKWQFKAVQRMDLGASSPHGISMSNQKSSDGTNGTAVTASGTQLPDCMLAGAYAWKLHILLSFIL